MQAGYTPRRALCGERSKTTSAKISNGCEQSSKCWDQERAIEPSPGEESGQRRGRAWRRDWTTPRVRAHVLLCMLAYHVEHHMRARLAPMLYDETDHEAAAALRASIVAKA